LGNKDVLAKMIGVKRLPDAATTLTRMFGKLKNLKTADILSRNVWAYPTQLIPWLTIGEDWLTFDSSVLVRYGNRRGQREDTILPSMADRAIILFSLFSTEVSM